MKISEFLKEIKTWEGTPYKNRKNPVKGSAAHCTNYIVDAAKTVAPEENKALEMPTKLSTRVLLLEAVDHMVELLKEAVDEVSPQDLKPGDIVVFRYKKAYAHMAVYLGAGNFIHSVTTTGVEYYHPAPNMLNNLEKVFRFRNVEPEELSVPDNRRMAQHPCRKPPI